jgi:hypothetical protein
MAHGCAQLSPTTQSVARGGTEFFFRVAAGGLWNSEWKRLRPLSLPLGARRRGIVVDDRDIFFFSFFYGTFAGPHG